MKAVLLLLLAASAHAAGPADPALPYRATLQREAQAMFGVGAPLPMLAGQIRQESNWRPNATAFDGGRGLAQFMDGTAAMVAARYPALGAPDPYNPAWAIRAMVWYDSWLQARVRGSDECQRWGAALKSYNAGLGYVQRAQQRSTRPTAWFNATEWINAGQSPANFASSRLYPRHILLVQQQVYQDWGLLTCGVAS